MRRAEALVIAAATIVTLFAAGVALRLGMRASDNPILTDHDIPHYATILVSSEPGVDLARDPVFAGRAALVWRAAVGYMSLLDAADVLAGHDFGAAILLLQLALLAIYLPGMALLLRSLGASLAVAIAVAVVSSVSSSFLVTGTRWGILTAPVPLVVCTAVAPWIALAMLRMTRRLPLVTATILCAPMLLINPATGMAMVELGVILALLAAARGLLSWKAFAWLFVAALVWTLLARQNINAASASFSFADAAEMIRYGQDNVMVFPFRGAPMSRLIGPALALHAALSIALFFFRSRRMVLALLIALQAAYAAFFLRAGWLMILPLAVALDDVRREELDDLDRWLWCALAVAIAVGPLQQLALLAVWQRLEIGALTALVFEGARFFQFAYIVAFALLARSMDAIARSFAVGWIRKAVVVFIVCAAYLNLDASPLSLRPGTIWLASLAALWFTRRTWLPWFGDGEGVDAGRLATALVFGAGVCLASAASLLALDIVAFRVPLAAGACATFVLVAFAQAKRDLRAFVAACGFAAVVGGPWLLLLLREPVRARSGLVHDSLAFALKLPRERRNGLPDAGPCQSDFARMTAAVGTATPPAALFHVTTFDRSFRAYARRSMLPVSDEWLIPIYDGAPIHRLREETAALWGARNDVAASRVLASRFGADYLVWCQAGRYVIDPLK